MLFAPILILGAALLPYLPGGLRMEHLLIPLLAGWVFFQAPRVHSESMWAVGGLTFAAIVTGLFSLTAYETGIVAEPISQLIRLLLPAMMLMAFPTMVACDPDASVIVAKVIVILAAGVGIFTAVSMVYAPIQVLLTLWVRSEEGATWTNAQDIGRFTGIFNQPIEAGIFYSVALIAAIHAIRFSTVSKPLLIVAMLIIIYGGTVSLSKNFIVLGVSSAVLYAFICGLVSRGAALGLIAPVAIILPAALERYNANYFDSLMDLYYEGGLLAALSAGRFGLNSGGEGSVSVLYSSLFATGDWVTGRGLGSQLPLDNGFLEYLYQGGILPLLGYLIALSVYSLFAWRNRHERDGKLLLVLMAYIWLASAGGPSITANRANVGLLLLAGACLIGVRRARSEQRPDMPKVDPAAVLGTPYARTLAEL